VVCLFECSRTGVVFGLTLDIVLMSFTFEGGVLVTGGVECMVSSVRFVVGCLVWQPGWCCSCACMA